MNLGKHLEYLFVTHDLTYGMVLSRGLVVALVWDLDGVSTSIIIYIGVNVVILDTSETFA